MRLSSLLATALFSLLAASTLAAAGPGPSGADLSATDLLEVDLPEVDGPAIDCAPPCGYIWPRIGVHSDIQSPFRLSELDRFPTESEIRLTYSWDLEQEGTGINDPTEPMQIVIVITRTPAFMSASLDRNVCDFTLLPVITEYEVCTLTLSVEIHPEYLPTNEDELREHGHRLMLFAASDESGTFMRSYGLEDIRFRFDEAGAEGIPSTADANEAPLPLMPLVAGLALVAAIAAARRARR
jgi:hypothetical protein